MNFTLNNIHIAACKLAMPDTTYHTRTPYIYIYTQTFRYDRWVMTIHGLNGAINKIWTSITSISKRYYFDVVYYFMLLKQSSRAHACDCFAIWCSAVLRSKFAKHIVKGPNYVVSMCPFIVIRCPIICIQCLICCILMFDFLYTTAWFFVYIMLDFWY